MFDPLYIRSMVSYIDTALILFKNYASMSDTGRNFNTFY